MASAFLALWPPLLCGRHCGAARSLALFVLIGLLVGVFPSLALPPSAFAQATVFPGAKKVVIGGTGHVPCKDNNGDDVILVQWEIVESPPPGPGTLVRRPTAAIRNQSITADMTFALGAGSPAYNGTLTITNLHYGGEAVNFTPTSQPLQVAPGSQATVQITINPLPNKVSPKKTLMITYRLSDPQDPNNFFQSGFPIDLYLVHDRPPQGAEQKPWLGVLDDACSWAEGLNDAPPIAKALTTGLFDADIFLYNGSSKEWLKNENVETFRLQAFLAAGRPVTGSCIEVANYLAICGNAVGLNFKCQQYRPLKDGVTYQTFRTEKICTIGAARSNEDNYIHYEAWAVHQVVLWPGNPVPADPTVYEACAAQLYDSDRLPLQGAARSLAVVQ